jgi:DNA-binding transcriptional MerR regulator
MSRDARALDTREVSDLTGVPISTLNGWVKAKLCRPSVLGPAGHRVSRYWHPRDVVVVRTIRALRNAGCEMSLIKRVGRLVEDEWSRPGDARALMYDGNDIYFIDEVDERLVSGGRNPGQALFPLSIHIAALPLDIWIDRVKDVGKEIDLTEERKRRRQLARAKVAARETRSFRATN